MKTCVLPGQAVYAGDLILVNREHGYRENTRPGLAAVPGRGGVRLQRRAALLLCELMKKIGGWDEIVPVSGWRSLREQQELWDGSLAENGPAFTEKYVALPGHSEHQTGLAIDLGLKRESIDFIRPAFPYGGICRTFRLHAASYGFVERYPAGGEAVTGIGHEPWHFRYVGVPHALIMEENGLTLEEYTDFIKGYSYGGVPLRYKRHGLDVTAAYLPSGGGETRLEINAETPYSISGNNADGFIITEWRGTYGNKAWLRRP